jgi:hypothetical protein
MLGKAQRLKGLTVKKIVPGREEAPPISRTIIDPLTQEPVTQETVLPRPLTMKVEGPIERVTTMPVVPGPSALEPVALEPVALESFIQEPIASTPAIIKTGRKITLKRTMPPPIPVQPPQLAPEQLQAQQVPEPSTVVRTGKKVLRRRKYGPVEEKYREDRDKELESDPYTLGDQRTFMPQTRLAFQNYMRTTFTPFAITEVPKPDFEACAKLGQRGEGVIERFLYQQFVREYLKQETPYRGLLVYHGLGSGKTCTSIAAAEALFGRSKKKIIVMTPGSLRNNFKSELTSCGFRHHSLQNHWVFLPMNETTRLFAKEVLGISPTSVIFTDMEKEPESQRGLWIPDFDKPTNYSSLAAWQQTSIRRQLNFQLEGRITFMSYNSARDTSKSRLQHIACNYPGYFDNAVIVIDEIHNITRMMCRKMDKELLERIRRGKNDPAFDPITYESWKPGVCATPYKHSRAYLLYRLLATAKGTKIIGLSGTPIINFPEEIAILANLLGGYIHTVEATIPVTPTAEADLQAVARSHPRIDYIDVQKAELKVRITYSVFPDKYKKVFDDNGAFKGVEYDEEAVQDPAEVHNELIATLKQKNISLSTPTFKSYSLLPPTKDDFYKGFIRESDLALMNQSILRRRLQGLVSYYRGSKEDLMPRVKEDILVQVPLGEYAYSKYFESRKTELESRTSTSMAKDIDELDETMNPAYYRFRSRSACNFVFPSDIIRPYPTNKKATELDTGIDKGPVITEADTVMTEEELADRIAEEPIEEEEGEQQEQPQQDTIQLRTYAEKLEDARRKLYERRDDILKIKDDPNSGLEKFSPKMTAILRKIEDLDTYSTSPAHFYGPHLVYSQFITMEGLGILGMAMEANGYVPIELEGPIEDIGFSKRTIESLSKGPEAKERRFMFFTSNSSPREREVLLNIFNGRFDKLPEKIKSILQTYYGQTGNLHGEIACVFGLGAAGAEGISLRNVRSVHIMEPYWNAVRTEQVKGRAIRICSHMQLPLEQRDVSVYTYCTVFQGKIDESLKISDGGLTSDQYINEIAKKKTAINQGILTIMKETAVDCTLNQMENQDTQCYVPKAASTDSYAYHPDIEYDLKNPPSDVIAPLVTTSTVAPLLEIKGITNTAAAKTMMAEKKIVSAPTRPGVEKVPTIAIKGREYIMAPKAGSGELFTLYDKGDTLKTRPLGLLKRDPVTGAFAVKLH